MNRAKPIGAGAWGGHGVRRPSSATGMLSFICTVRNGDRFLDQCLESVATHYPDCELVVVDDGSTDDTAALLARWARARPEVRVISTGGVGRGAALNLALQASHHPYVANIDADDIALPGRLELVKHLLESDDRVGLAAGLSRIISQDGSANGAAARQPEVTPESFRPVDVGPRLYRGNQITHICVVMRKSALNAVGGYDASRRTQLDYDLWVRLRDAGFALHQLPITVAAKRLHPGQMFARRKPVNYVLNSIRVQLRAASSWRERLVVGSLAGPRLAWAMVPGRLRELYSKRAP